MPSKIASLKNCKNIQELKELYRKLVFIYHPDKGGSTKDMQDLNGLYEDMYNVLLNNMDKTTKEYKRAKSDIPKEYMDIINKLINMEGLIIDIIGTWIWLKGETYKYKEDIKKLGFRWSNAPERKAWYYTSDIMDKCGKYKKSSDDVLKDKYGCTTIIAKKYDMLT